MYSFETFSIAQGRSAYFLAPTANITNVFSRVTGDNASQILGTLGIRNADRSLSDANLYLMNPNGIMFGANASQSKYSAARVRERISADGTVAPVSEPKKTKDGLYQRPAGRKRRRRSPDSRTAQPVDRTRSADGTDVPRDRS